MKNQLKDNYMYEHSGKVKFIDLLLLKIKNEKNE